MLNQVMRNSLLPLALMGCIVTSLTLHAALIVLDPSDVLTALDDGSSQGDEVGAAVGIDGDLAVLGVPGDDAGRGSVMVFAWNGERWKWQLTIKAPDFDGVQPGRFGDALIFAHGTLAVGAPWSTTSAGAKAGAVYVLDATSSWALQEVVTSPTGRSGDQFGHALSATDQTLIVAGNNIAYAFNRTSGHWASEAVLLPPEQFGDWPAMVNRSKQPSNPADQLFDYANDVAVSGNTALIGAPGHQSVYAFIKVSGVWRMQARIGSPRPAPGTVPPVVTGLPGPPSPPQQVYDAFGCSVALLGDTALIGALGGNDVDLDGAAYIYQRTTTAAWVKRVEMTPESSHSSFGRRVVLTPGRALIGSYHVARPNSAPTGSSRGAVYVYDVSGLTFNQTAIIDAPFDRAGIFGDGIALSGNRILAGDVGLPAPYLTVALENGSQYPIVDGGAAHVFAFDGASWVKQDTLLQSSSGLADGNLFGSAIATSGDTMAIGMPGDRNAGSTPTTTAAGSVLVFHRTSGQWTQQARLFGPAGRSQFGSCVAVDGRTLVAGYPQDFPRIFEQDDSGNWLPAANLPEPGNAVAVADGRVFVGNRLGSLVGGGITGRVVVYTKLAGVWTVEATLYPSDGANGDEFGQCLAAEGDTLVVGAPKQDQRGALYVYHRAVGGWVQQSKLTAGAFASINAQFGFSAALRDSVLVAGQPWAGSSQSGSAFVFLPGPGSTWVMASRLLPPQERPNARFGWSVAVENPAVIVGEPFGLSASGQIQGAAHFFRRSGDQWAEASKLAEMDGGMGLGGAPGNQFGAAVAMAGREALAGAPGAANEFGSTAGTVSVFGVLGRPQLEFSVNGQPIAPGATVDFGQTAVGASNTRVVTVTNVSGVPITGLSFVLEGGQSSEAGFSSTLNVTTLEAGFSTNVGLFFAPGATGLRVASLRFASPDLDPAVPTAVALQIEGTLTEGPPVIDVAPASQVAVVGDAVEFQVQAHGTGPIGYRWLKNGQVIPGATTRALRLLSVHASDAARYGVEVANAEGKVVSDVFNLIVFARKDPVTVVVKAGAPLSFKGPAFTGPGPFGVGWSVNGSSIVTIPEKPLWLTLNFGPAIPRWDGAVFALHAANSLSAAREVARFHVRIVYPAEILPVAIGTWTVAGQVQGRLLATHNPAKFTATGLPPGVKLTTAGVFTGQPAAPGSYAVHCRAWNEIGAGPEQVVPVTVLPLAASAQGSFAGLFGVKEGRFNAQVSTSGFLTAQFLFQGKSYQRSGFVTKGTTGIYRFSTLISATSGPHLITDSTSTLSLTLLPGSRSLTGSVETTETDHGIFTAGLVVNPPRVTNTPLTAYRNPWSNSGLASPQAGLFTARLSGGTPRVANDPRPLPEGDGYASLSLSPTGSITWSGRMADGSISTGSTALLEQGRIPLCLPLAWKGVVQGWLAIPQEEPFDHSVLEGSVVWDGGGPRVTRIYPASFSLQNVVVEGGTYNAPAQGALLPGFPISQPNARLFFEDGGLDDSLSGLSPTFTLPVSGTPVLLPAGAVSANSLTLLKFSAVPATGLFGGSFRVNTTKLALPAVLRDVSFQGVMVQRFGGGTGYFLMPQLPVPPQTLKTSPILSGFVLLEPFSIGGLPGQ